MNTRRLATCAVLFGIALLALQVTGMISRRSVARQNPGDPFSAYTASLKAGAGALAGPNWDVPQVPARQSGSEDASPYWWTEHVDYPKSFWGINDRSLQLDADGQPHVAYGGDRLYYARHDGGQWRYEVVDGTPGVGWNAALALDGAGNPHISYGSGIDRWGLKYARYDGSNWHVETVLTGSEEDVRWASLALDTAGRPHISYYDLTNAALRYAWHDGTMWRFQTVDSEAQALYHLSLGMDSKDHPHIAYSGSPDWDLKYAWHDGTAWHMQVVDSDGEVGFGASLALDSADRPHISYYAGYPNYGLRYARQDGLTWAIESITVADDFSGCAGTALALHGDTERPHIIYCSGAPNFGIMHDWHDGISWRHETVDDAQYDQFLMGISGTSVAVDSTGGLHVTYDRARCTMHSCEGGDLRYARQDGATWLVETLDEKRAVGPHSSLAIDSRGHPHIIYAETYPIRRLWYARHDGLDWQREVIENTGDIDDDSIALALDSLDRPHISYAAADDLQRTIQYAWHDGSAWRIEAVDIVSVEEYQRVRTSLALDAATGRPHISYDGPSLKYAWHDGASWQIESPEGDQHAVIHTSLALDGMGHPHISYCDATNTDLKVAWHDGSAWHSETVEAEGWVGSSNSLALDGSDRPHISYSDASHSDLKYAWHDGTAWHIETVDSTGDVGASSSLALDKSGRPHISYHDVDNQDLKYAFHDGTTWTIEQVDTQGYVGWSSSLALDANTGRPHISYYDYSGGAIKHAILKPQLLALAKQAMPNQGVLVNETLTYTLTFSGAGLSFRLWDPLPAEVRYVTGTLTTAVAPPAVYSATAHAVSWVGDLAGDTVQTVRFQVASQMADTGTLSLSPPIMNTAWLTDTDRGFSVSATVIVNGWTGRFPFFPQGR